MMIIEQKTKKTNRNGLSIYYCSPFIYRITNKFL